VGADTRRERVVLETERHRIVGDITLPAKGYHSRLSDLLNREGIEFIPLLDVTINGQNGDLPQHLPFIAVARDHIQVPHVAD
jgi:Family of unknown function (DUF6812)